MAMIKDEKKKSKQYFFYHDIIEFKGMMEHPQIEIFCFFSVWKTWMFHGISPNKEGKNK
jgi:hypothetical protein